MSDPMAIANSADFLQNKIAGAYPPAVWFDKANADTGGPQKGVVLEYDKYDSLLQHYYDQRGYDKRGIPTLETLKKLDLEAEAAAAARVAKLN